MTELEKLSDGTLSDDLEEGEIVDDDDNDGDDVRIVELDDISSTEDNETYQWKTDDFVRSVHVHKCKESSRCRQDRKGKECYLVMKERKRKKSKSKDNKNLVTIVLSSPEQESKDPIEVIQINDSPISKRRDKIGRGRNDKENVQKYFKQRESEDYLMKKWNNKIKNYSRANNNIKPFSKFQEKQRNGKRKRTKEIENYKQEIYSSSNSNTSLLKKLVGYTSLENEKNIKKRNAIIKEIKIADDYEDYEDIDKLRKAALQSQTNNLIKKINNSVTNSLQLNDFEIEKSIVFKNYKDIEISFSDINCDETVFEDYKHPSFTDKEKKWHLSTVFSNYDGFDYEVYIKLYGDYYKRPEGIFRKYLFSKLPFYQHMELCNNIEGNYIFMSHTVDQVPTEFTATNQIFDMASSIRTNLFDSLPLIYKSSYMFLPVNVKLKLEMTFLENLFNKQYNIPYSQLNKFNENEQMGLKNQIYKFNETTRINVDVINNLAINTFEQSLWNLMKIFLFNVNENFWCFPFYKTELYVQQTGLVLCKLLNNVENDSANNSVKDDDEDELMLREMALKSLKPAVKVHSNFEEIEESILYAQALLSTKKVNGSKTITDKDKCDKLKSENDTTIKTPTVNPLIIKINEDSSSSSDESETVTKPEEGMSSEFLKKVDDFLRDVMNRQQKKCDTSNNAKLNQPSTSNNKKCVNQTKALQQLNTPSAVKKFLSINKQLEYKRLKEKLVNLKETTKTILNKQIKVGPKISNDLCMLNNILVEQIKDEKEAKVENTPVEHSKDTEIALNKEKNLAMEELNKMKILSATLDSEAVLYKSYKEEVLKMKRELAKMIQKVAKKSKLMKSVKDEVLLCETSFNKRYEKIESFSSIDEYSRQISLQTNSIAYKSMMKEMELYKLNVREAALKATKICTELGSVSTTMVKTIGNISTRKRLSSFSQGNASVKKVKMIPSRGLNKISYFNSAVNRNKFFKSPSLTKNKIFEKKNDNALLTKETVSLPDSTEKKATKPWNPNQVVCTFGLDGECKDPDCQFVHLDS